jgi:hypothetical protein
MINKLNTQFLKCLLMILTGVSVSAQTRVDIINPGFESRVKGWENITVDNSEFYAPVEGDWYAVQKNDGSKTYQKTGHVIKRGEKYTFKLWARSINPAGDSAKTIAEISMFFDSTTIVSAEKYVNAPQLKGAAAVYPNDDGANVWVDGNYRHEFADYHLYQPVSYDPIKDPWLLVKNSSYRKLKGFGWAVGTVIIGGRKFIYGTLYRDKPENFYSSVTLTKVLTTNGYNYTWSKPVTVISHSKTEIPWVEDPNCYYDESTGKLWMAWGGGTCYVSELYPESGLLPGHPADVEFNNLPQKNFTPVATWPETRNGWCGDKWSKCWMEGTAIYKHNGYWYFFGSYGSLSKDYTIRYGRGKSPAGPYYDKEGVSMMEFDKARNKYGNTMLLGAEGEQLVPGHPQIWEENGKYYMGYDYRKTADKEMDYMGIRRLYWVDDRPTIWMPVTVSFIADEHPKSIGKKLCVSFRNAGEGKSVLAVDYVSLIIKQSDGIK